MPFFIQFFRKGRMYGTKNAERASTLPSQLVMFSCVAALCGAMVYNSLVQYLNQDEEQYVTAAILTQHMRLYADFLYLQPPIYPLLLSKLLTLFSTVSHFLVARLLSAAMATGAVLVFFSLAARLAKNAKCAFLIASLFASAPLMLLAYGETRNDIMPIFFGLCGVWFVLRGSDVTSTRRGHQLSLFLAGVCMALAVGVKFTAAFIPLAALIYLYLKAKYNLILFVLGGVVGSIPILYYIVTDIEKFFYCTVTFHLSAPRQFYTDIGLAKTLTWLYRLKSVTITWVNEPSLVAASSFLAFFTLIAWRRHLRLEEIGSDRTFIILLALMALPFVFLPNPFGWPYLQPMVPYVLLSCAALYPTATKLFERPQMFILMAIGLISLTVQIQQFVIRKHLNRHGWTVAEVHDLSLLVARHVKRGPVATLHSMLVNDAGSVIYPEFSASVYFYRSADHLPPARVLELRGISPKTIPIVLGAKTPAAVFVGNTPSDGPLLNWAQSNCYVEVDLGNWQDGPYFESSWQPHLFIPHAKGETCGSS